ncbi:MAG: hypothetical protein LBS32_03320 [Clostridiales Family XIII bacterium]|jgi:hypothetical protein|nr:hypothetical protein [Clostridiales Family XIII bacterium]
MTKRGVKASAIMIFAALLAALLSTGVCLAEDSLKLLSNYPEEGANSSPPFNLGIKLFFDGDVADESVREANEACFRMVGEDGAEVPLKPLYTEADPTYILVVAEPKDAKEGLGSDKEYRFTISGALQSADGLTLGEDETITFRTRNTSTDMTLSMVMMGIMVAGMLVFTTLSVRRQARKAAENDAKAKVNPYKVAKETGKSVEAIVEKEDRRKQRLAEQKKKQASGKGGAAAEAPAPEPGPRTKRVKRPRPISAAGSSYVSGRKAAAEKRAREEAARRAKGTTKPKGSSSKGRKRK